MAGEGLLAQMVVDKYMDHLPIHRQLQRFERVGVTISQSTSNDWMRNTLNSLIGIYELHKKQVLESRYLHADETTIKVQDENKKDKTHLGYYWLYHDSEQNLALFDYRKGRGREGPDEILKNFKGFLQTDGHVTYDDFDLRAAIILLHCMAHSRRKFSEAMDNDAPRATYVLERMQVLYGVERRIKEEMLAPDQILALRQSESLPVLKELKEWMLAQISIVLPKSPIGQAIAYSLKRWDKLCIYTNPNSGLVDGLRRIRHFGILSSSAKEKSLALIREQLPHQLATVDIINVKADPVIYNPKQCPCCKKETMQRVMQFRRRGPPPDWRKLAMDLLEMVK